MSSKPNRISEARKKAGLSQQALAEKVGSHWITISKLERGKMQLTADWLRRLSEAMGTDMPSLLPGEHTLYREVDIEGRLLDDGSLQIIPPEDGARFLPGEGHDDYHSFWVECGSDALFPFFGEHDVIRFTEVTLNGRSELAAIGRLCCVTTADAADLVGILDGHQGAYSIALPGQRPRRGLTLTRIAIAVEARFSVPWGDDDIAD